MTNVTIAQLKEALKKQKEELLDEHFKRQEEALQSQKDELLQSFSKQQEAFKNELLNKFAEQQNNWSAELLAVKQVSEQNADEILRLKGTIESLVVVNKLQSETVSKLTEKLEDRTNRQLRNTLIFKGIPETAGEKKGKQQWDETRKVLSETLAKHVPGLDAQSASNMFERVHRGKAGALNVNKRKIYARVFDWNVSEGLKNDMRTANIKDSSINIYLTNFRAY